MTSLDQESRFKGKANESVFMQMCYYGIHFTLTFKMIRFYLLQGLSFKAMPHFRAERGGEQVQERWACLFHRNVRC